MFDKDFWIYFGGSIILFILGVIHLWQIMTTM